MPDTPLRALLFLLGVWLALELVGPLAPAARGDTGGPDPALEALAAQLHEAVNRTRAEHHLVPLERVSVLDRAARRHSADMAARRYLSHESPEGTNPVDRIRGAGAADFTLAGENVGLTSRGQPNREILQGWLHSPIHRRNLLHPAFNATGLAIARSADGSLYYTQVYVTLPKE